MYENNKSLILWLGVTCFLIWLMIMLGGATRLTHSGLSIVEWKPVTGIIPPFTLVQWQEEFYKYQQFPEYQQINYDMSLQEFKFIYGMEYAHRLLGRLIGIVFFIPLFIFWTRGYLPTFMKRRSLLVLGLGALQGGIGWYMVKSGLVKDPAVSHYRLTLHLGLAIVLYGLLLWSLFELKVQKQVTAQPASRLRPWAYGSLVLLCLTIVYGGFVAGLKAGLIYNTFPLMEGQFLPKEWDFMNPIILNFVANAATVQWVHRWLAIITFIIVSLTLWKTLRAPYTELRRSSLLLGGAILGQVLLGILTLLHHVPVFLGTLHQGWAVVVFSSALWLVWQVRQYPLLDQRYRVGGLPK